MIKGYVFKNQDKDWELGFLSNIGAEGEALYTTYKTYRTWGEAFYALVRKQIEEQ